MFENKADEELESELIRVRDVIEKSDFAIDFEFWNDV